MDNNQNLNIMDKKLTFFKFGSKGYLNTLHVEPKVLYDAEKRKEKYPYDGNLYLDLWFGEYPDNLDFPVEFIADGGTKLRDVIDTYTPWLTLISDHVRQVFEDNGLTGWKPYDVIVRRKSGEEITGFNGFSIIGRLPEGWDNGEVEIPDFFRVPPAVPVCSQRVVKVLKKNKLTCFDPRLIDKGYCERAFDIRKGIVHPEYEYSDFFEKVYDSLTSAEQQKQKQ